MNHIRVHLVLVFKYYCSVLSVVKIHVECYRITSQKCYCCLNTENCYLINNSAKHHLTLSKNGNNRFTFLDVYIMSTLSHQTFQFFFNK